MTDMPLVVTEDFELRDEIGRIAAAAGSEVTHASRPTSVDGEWSSTPLVVLDVPAARAALAANLPRRRGVCVVTRGEVSQVWQPAFELGARDVYVLPANEERLAETFTDLLDGATETGATGRVLAVIGGCGGAGTSSLATAVAAVAARDGERALLVDCDPLGGGLDLAAGWEKSTGLRWSGVAVGTGQLPAGALHAALPTRGMGSGTLSVLACDRADPTAGISDEAVRAVLGAARKAGDVAVCDLPRALPPAAVVALRYADLVVVLTRAEVRACASAAYTVARLRELVRVPTLLVLRGTAASGLRGKDIREVVGLEPFGTLRDQRDLTAAMDRSGICSGGVHRRGPLARTAREILDELASTAVPPMLTTAA